MDRSATTLRATKGRSPVKAARRGSISPEPSALSTIPRVMLGTAMLWWPKFCRPGGEDVMRMRLPKNPVADHDQAHLADEGMMRVGALEVDRDEARSVDHRPA